MVCEAIRQIAVRRVAPFYSLGAGLGKRVAMRIFARPAAIANSTRAREFFQRNILDTGIDFMLPTPKAETLRAMDKRLAFAAAAGSLNLPLLTGHAMLKSQHNGSGPAGRPCSKVGTGWVVSERLSYEIQ